MPALNPLAYLGQPVRRRPLESALQTGGAARPSALFNAQQYAAANPGGGGRDFSLSVSPQSAMDAKLNDPVLRAMLGPGGALAAGATSGRLAADTERTMNAPFPQPRHDLAIEQMRQQGWQQAREFDRERDAERQAMAREAAFAGVLQNQANTLENRLTAMLELGTPPDSPQVQSLQEEIDQLYSQMLLANPMSGEFLMVPTGGQEPPVRPPATLREMLEETTPRTKGRGIPKRAAPARRPTPRPARSAIERAISGELGVL